ncbi:hypothetical protein [Vulgatibacter sp.]|uniref:hypothetical protein n=1 Tax=Vulgatibacter sp. TaxID=1971226 RepID=UPI003567E602
MKSFAWKTMAALGAMALAACGSENDGTQPSGEPVAELQGEVRGSVGNGTRLQNPSVALVWARFDDPNQQPVFATEVAALPGNDPSSFSLPVFSNPPAAMLEDWDVDYDGNADLRLAFGSVFAFEDVNGDGAVALHDTGVDAPDRVFGVSWEHQLLYVDTIYNQAALGQIVSNPQEVVAGQLLLAEYDICSFGPAAIVPFSTPVVLWTFTPTSDVSEADLPLDELECSGEIPGMGGVCGDDPGSEACAACMDRAFSTCSAGCDVQTAAFESCMTTNGCDRDPTGSCIETHCSAEADAVYQCIGGCSAYDECYTDAAE